MSIHETRDGAACGGECPDCLAEEDLSDEALECVDCAEAGFDHAALVAAETAARDRYDAETGEVLKDAPGWDPDTKRITNNEGCNFFGALLRETLEAMAENERLAAPEIAALERKLEVARLRLARAQKPLESRSAWLEGAIRVYADEHRAEVLRGQRKDAKSRRFPSGLRVAWKSGGGGYRWRKDLSASTREAMLLRWATDRTGPATPLTKMERVFDLAAVKAYAADMTKRDQADTGTFERVTPPGLEYVPEHERLDVTVEGDK